MELGELRLESEQCTHGDFLCEREPECKAHLEKSARQERADIDRLKAVLDFAVSSIKNATYNKDNENETDKRHPAGFCLYL